MAAPPASGGSSGRRPASRFLSHAAGPSPENGRSTDRRTTVNETDALEDARAMPGHEDVDAHTVGGGP